MEYTVIDAPCKTVLYRHNTRRLPFNYDINVYRGCAHRCISAVRQRFPALYKDMTALYADRAAWRDAQEKAFEIVRRLRAQYRIPAYVTLKPKSAPEQLSLF